MTSLRGQIPVAPCRPPSLQGAFFWAIAVQLNVRNNIDQVLSRMDGYKRDVVDKAVVRALNRTAESARTQASREIKGLGYNFSAAEIKDAIALSKASQGRLSVSLRVRRRPKSLMEFNPTQTKAGVYVKVGGSRKMIKGAFIAQLRNGAMGVYVEDKSAGKTVLRKSKQFKRGSKGGWHEYPARKLYGPSVGGVYGTDRMQAVMARVIRQTFMDRLQHEVQYLSR